MNIEILTFQGDFKEREDPTVLVIQAKLDTQVFHFEEGCVGKAKTSFVEEKKKKARFHCDADVNKKQRRGVSQIVILWLLSHIIAPSQWIVL